MGDQAMTIIAFLFAKNSFIIQNDGTINDNLLASGVTLIETKFIYHFVWAVR